MKEVLPILAALLVLLGGAFTAAVAVVMLSSGSCGPVGRPVGVVLIYQLDPQSKADPQPVDMQALVAAIQRRINAGRSKNARVRQLDQRRIEIGIFGHDPQNVDRIERLLNRPGTLEVRILANRHDHKPLIARAQAEKGSVVRGPDGEVQAWWVPVAEGAALKEETPGFVPEYWEIEERTRKQGRREVVEVLVVKDPFDITGAYLEEAAAEKDQFGRPCVGFEFNSAGAALLLALSSDNLPDPLQAFTRRLGIIVDGKLVSAPAIESPISKRARITGTLSRQQVADLVDVLNAGALPARIKLVEKREAGAGR